VTSAHLRKNGGIAPLEFFLNHATGHCINPLIQRMFNPFESSIRVIDKEIACMDARKTQFRVGNLEDASQSVG